MVATVGIAGTTGHCLHHWTLQASPGIAVTTEYCPHRWALPAPLGIVGTVGHCRLQWALPIPLGIADTTLHCQQQWAHVCYSMHYCCELSNNGRPREVMRGETLSIRRDAIFSFTFESFILEILANVQYFSTLPDIDYYHIFVSA